MQSIEMQTMMKNLEQYRHQHEWSQTQFAEMIGLSKSSYCKLVRGETNTLTVDTMKKIYEVTGNMCYQLMEVFTDDYLILGNEIKDFSPHEMKCMLQFVRVYKETRKRVNAD